MAESEGPITFADLGITKVDATTDTFVGKVRSCGSLEKKEIAFLVVSLLSIVATIGLTIERLINVDKSSADFTFAIVFIINCFACIYYVLSGVYFERYYELGVLVVATALLWIYLVINYAVGYKGSFKLARMVVASVLSPCVIVLGALLIKNYSESKNLIFRTVGAKAALQEICNTLFMFNGLLKGDLQINISMSVLILTSGYKVDLEDKICLPLVLFVAFLSAALGYLSGRLENKTIGICWAIMWITIPTYAVYLIVKSVTDLKDHDQFDDRHDAIRVVSLIASVASILVRCLLLYYGFRVYLNFGKGLREKVYGKGPSAVRESSNEQSGSIQIT